MIKEAAIGIGLYLLFRKKKPAADAGAVVPEGTVSPLEMEAAHEILSQKIAAGDTNGAAQVAAEMEAAGIPTAKILPVYEEPSYAPAEVGQRFIPDQGQAERQSEVTQRRVAIRPVCNTNVDCTDDQQYLESFPSTM